MSKSYNLLIPHDASRLKHHRPSLDYLTRYVEKGDDPSDHWFWTLDPNAKNPRRIGRRGQAIISWSPKVDIRRGIFCVARLLVEYVKGPFPEYSVFEPLCPVSSCVNPDHWKWREPHPRYRFDNTAEGWRIAECRNTKPVQTRLLLAVRDQHGVVHAVPALPRHTSRYVAMCEASIIPEVSVVLATNTIITCKGGC